MRSAQTSEVCCLRVMTGNSHPAKRISFGCNLISASMRKIKINVFSKTLPESYLKQRDLRIHLDGGPPGTMGRIGLTGNADELNDFQNRMINYLSKYGTMTLIVPAPVGVQ